MEVRTIVEQYGDVVADTLVVPVFEGESADDGLLKDLDEKSDRAISSLLERREFRGKPNETAYIHSAPGLKARRLMLVGIGKEDKFTHNQMRHAAGTAMRALKSKRMQTIAFLSRTGLDGETLGHSIVEGAHMALFDMDTYKTKERDEQVISEIVILTDDNNRSSVEKGAQRGKIIGESINIARQMSNEPGSNLTPKDIAKRSEEIAAASGLTIDLLDEAKMQELGMGSLLGVSRGSIEEARLIVLKYEHPDAKGDQTIALVGKGITFDTGGISIKPSEGMERMKYDMSGAAAVLAAMRSIGLLKPRVRVVGVMACAENMPSGTAIKPGDVLKSMSGKTIEVINTDAEGRLVLADAITYAKEKLGATHIVDIATLTGAIGVALGPVHIGLFSNSEQMINELVEAGKRAGERLWNLPLDDEYAEQIRSEIADMKNTGGRPAGSITAACFLKEFAEDTPWAHLDIASTGWNLDKKPYLSKGPTGVGIRTFVSWILSKSN
jgi:leucyl aminopeptidase